MPDSPADRARAVVERLPATVVACSHCPKPSSHAHDFSPAANAAVDVIKSALRAERAAVWAMAADLMTKQTRNGGFWPHACSSCGLDDEEHHAVQAERMLLNRIAAALRARGEAGG